MIEKMNHHYSMTNPATVYDEEALTTLELVGRTTAKVNECVESFNTLEEETNDHLQEQDNTIADRLDAQDKSIKKMNDETMPKKVSDEMSEQIENGTFDNQINYYLGNLEERVNNLLGSVTAGSTTMDAEIIDARTGADGKGYSNIGESIRVQDVKAIVVDVSNYERILPDLNLANKPKYILNFPTNSEPVIANSPFDFVPSSVMLFEHFERVSANNNLCFQRLSTTDRTWCRWGMTDGTFQNWTNGTPVMVTVDNYQKIMPDLNGATETENYLFLFGLDATLPENMPITSFREENVSLAYMEVKKSGVYTYQTFMVGGVIYQRYKGGSTWYPWISTRTIPAVVDSVGDLSDANNAKNGVTYFINFLLGTPCEIANLPFESIPDDLMTLTTHVRGAYGVQEITPTTKKWMWRRRKAGEWQAWYRVYDFDGGNTEIERVTVTVGATGDYKKLTDALKFANGRGNVDVYVKPGVYDIIEELGADYWENYTGYSESNDMNLGNNNTYTFSPNAKVVCHYTGDNASVTEYFSIFNSLSGSMGSFVLDGAVVESSGIRYAIHDDISGRNEQQTHVYRNCELSSDDSRAIGGGFGSNSTYIIENCVFHAGMSWHNSHTDGSNKIVVKDCVFDNNAVLSFQHYGQYATLSKALVSNNVLANDIVLRFENEESTYENIQLIEWNNVVKTE